jgi:DNA-nicking Smr family endonuclease
MSKDDADWEQAIEGVKPLKKREKPRINTKDYTVEDWDDLAEKSRDEITSNESHNTSKLVSEYPQKVVEKQPFKIHSNIASKLSGSVLSVDSRTLKKLAQGKVSPEAKIDLHGFYADDAFGALMDFLHKAAAEGLRCVLVVHGKGKGYGPKQDMGIIKSQVSAWLCGHPKVLAYHTATIRHGSNGALYVLLKRQN